MPGPLGFHVNGHNDVVEDAMLLAQKLISAFNEQDIEGVRTVTTNNFCIFSEDQPFMLDEVVHKLSTWVGHYTSEEINWSGAQVRVHGDIVALWFPSTLVINDVTIPIFSAMCLIKENGSWKIQTLADTGRPFFIDIPMVVAAEDDDKYADRETDVRTSLGLFISSLGVNQADCLTWQIWPYAVSTLIFHQEFSRQLPPISDNTAAVTIRNVSLRHVLTEYATFVFDNNLKHDFCELSLVKLYGNFAFLAGPFRILHARTNAVLCTGWRVILMIRGEEDRWMVASMTDTAERLDSHHWTDRVFFTMD